jgi:hypothetical protein
MKLLIAAGEAASEASGVPSSVRELIATADEVLVIAPILPGRFEWLSSATDKAREQADERLQTVLGHVSEMHGSGETRGEVAADDPLLAFEDAIREFAPDHVLIGLRSSERSNWQERGLLDQVIARFGLPLTVFELDES